MFGFIFKKIFGSKNDRYLRRLRPIVARINALEPQMQELADEDFAQRMAEYRRHTRRKVSLRRAPLYPDPNRKAERRTAPPTPVFSRARDFFCPRSTPPLRSPSQMSYTRLRARGRRAAYLRPSTPP